LWGWNGLWLRETKAPKKNRATKKFLLALLFFCYAHTSFSTEVRDLHATLHVTTGFAVQAVAYGAWKKILGPNGGPAAAHLLATATTALAAGAWEAKGVNPSARDFGFGLAGAAGFSVSALFFKF
jgi:hypothetical protein